MNKNQLEEALGLLKKVENELLTQNELATSGALAFVEALIGHTSITFTAEEQRECGALKYIAASRRIVSGALIEKIEEEWRQKND